MGLIKAPSDQTRIKAACLKRDGNRCVVTSYYDSVEALKDFTARQLENMGLMYTEGCHIVLFSLGSFPESEVN